MSMSTRLDRMERRAAERAQSTPPGLTVEQGMRVLARLSEISDREGGPEGLRAWLTAHGPPHRVVSTPGLDWARLTDKLTDMATVWHAPEENRAAAVEGFTRKWATDRAAWPAG